ncbi:MAG: 4-hydroxy-3-methylbut-2-enyl diphosphate reductase [Endomicrobiia bacterium]
MTEIIVSKYIGFCSGVKRCINITEKEIFKNKKVFALGELVHNEEEIKRLSSLGLTTINSIQEINPTEDNFVLIIRAHGIEKNILEEINKKIKNCINGTCPIVEKNQKIVSEYSNKGYNIVIYGDVEHPEIKALTSYINPNTKYSVINSLEEIKKLNFSPKDKILLISQTTKEVKEYEKIIEELKRKFKNLKVSYSICKETILREENTKNLAQKVDCVVIIGGKNSANTKKLVNIAKNYNKNVLLISSKSELNIEELKKYKKIGIVSGASTPKWLVEKIVKKLDFLS